MQRIRKWFFKRTLERVAKEAMEDQMCYGQSAHIQIKRHWLNPMKYLAGPYAVKRLNPMDLVVRFK